MNTNKNIVFCNTLPLTFEAYKEGLKSDQKDFMHHYKKSRIRINNSWDWEAYKNELVVPYKLLEEGYANQGILFINECTWENFKTAVLDKKFVVAILFSHCIQNGTLNEEIEFFDSMVMSNEILKILPNQKRVYDFAVCNSTYLQKKITIEKNQSVAGTSTKPIALSIWLYIYALTFEQMIVKKKGFIEAMNDVLIRTKSRNNKIENI